MSTGNVRTETAELSVHERGATARGAVKGELREKIEENEEVRRGAPRKERVIGNGRETRTPWD